MRKNQLVKLYFNIYKSSPTKEHLDILKEQYDALTLTLINQKREKIIGILKTKTDEQIHKNNLLKIKRLKEILQ